MDKIITSLAVLLLAAVIATAEDAGPAWAEVPEWSETPAWTEQAEWSEVPAWTEDAAWSTTPRWTNSPSWTGLSPYVEMLRRAGLLWTPRPARFTPVWISMQTAGDDPAKVEAAHILYRQSLDRRKIFEALKEK